MRRQTIQNARRIVVKLGTALLASSADGIDRRVMDALAGQVARALDRGTQAVLVSSGAIGAGMHRMGRAARAADIAQIQSAAAVGQVELMRAWSEAFADQGRVVAQILLTRDGLDDRTKHLNARNTMNELLRAGVVPVVNENDTVSVDEIRFGDNDMLSALTADLVDAELLVLLSDVPGLLQDGRVLPEVERVDKDTLSLAWKGTSRGGTGGMDSKLAAVRAAAAVGVASILADGRAEGILDRILAGEDEGTFFRPTAERGAARKRWLLMHTVPGGALVVNAGAARAIVEGNKSLLAVGVTDVRGAFAAGDAIEIVDESGAAIARGIVSLSSEDVARVKGQPSPFLETILGRATADEIVHRDHLAVGNV